MTEKDEMLARLRKVEGQIRGLQKMIEDERACSDVITQVVAASKALDKVGFMVVSHSVKDCAVRSLETGEDPTAVLGDAIKTLIDLAKRGV